MNFLQTELKKSITTTLVEYFKNVKITPTQNVIISHSLEEYLNIFQLQKIIKEISIENNVDIENIKIEIFSDDYSCNGAYTELQATYRKDVLKSDKQMKIELEKRINSQSFSKIYSDMKNIENIKRTGFSTALLKEFDDTSIYNMLVNKDYDRLVKYFSLYFSEIN